MQISKWKVVIMYFQHFLQHVCAVPLVARWGPVHSLITSAAKCTVALFSLGSYLPLRESVIGGHFQTGRGG